MPSTTKLLFLSVLAISFLIAPPQAKALANPAGAPDYAKATKLLAAGKNFEQAIPLLQSAVKAHPTNPDYHLALGCVYADRAASLSYAYNWRYKMPDLEAPPKNFHAYTKDDGKPFLLTKDQAQSLIAALGRGAQAEWQVAVSLCKNRAARANAEYIEGWGMWALGIYSPPWNSGSNSRGMPGHDDVVNAFQAATRDDPSRSAYWESLGFISTNYLKTDRPDYERALRLQPHNPALWYVLFSNYLQDAFNQAGISNAQKSYDSPAGVKAAAALKECVLQEPTNALPMYELAYVDLDSTPYQNNRVNSIVSDLAQRERVDITMEASLSPADKKRAKDVLALMDRAGKAASCSAPVYVPPVPALLTGPWSYYAAMQVPDLHSNSYFRELARDFYGVSAADEIEHNIPDAIHAQKAVIRMGQQLIGPWTIPHSVRFESDVEGLVGITIADIGYSNLIKIEQQYGTPADASHAKAEYAAFKARATAYTNAVEAKVSTNVYSKY